MPQTLTARNSFKTASVSIATYTALKSAVRKTISLGKERATAAVEREKVRTSWEVGKLICDHILLKKKRADYGQKVIERLARDLGLSKRYVAYMVEFSKEYPIVPTSAQLSWSHYRELLAVNVVEKRNAIQKRAEKENWSVAKLRAEINRNEDRSPRAGSIGERSMDLSPNQVGLSPMKLSPLDVYRTRLVNGESVIDLGFSTYLDKKIGDRSLALFPGMKIVNDRNFTYQAEIESVVDGDTVWCVVDLGFGVKTRQKLRLRGLDAPEVISKDGQLAKRYLSRKLPQKSKVIITTAKSDKFDRYLADIWVGEKYINQQLITSGHANAV